MVAILLRRNGPHVCQLIRRRTRLAPPLQSQHFASTVRHANRQDMHPARLTTTRRRPAGRHWRGWNWGSRDTLYKHGLEGTPHIFTMCHILPPVAFTNSVQRSHHVSQSRAERRKYVTMSMSSPPWGRMRRARLVSRSCSRRTCCSSRTAQYRHPHGPRQCQEDHMYKMRRLWHGCPRAAQNYCRTWKATIAERNIMVMCAPRSRVFVCTRLFSYEPLPAARVWTQPGP